MLVNRERDKLLSAIIYFVRTTKYCHTLKLFKLLNFLDFEHFRQTGRTVTGLRYSAWVMGPVPDDLWNEIVKGGDADMRAAITIIEDDGQPSRAALRTIDHGDDWQGEQKQYKKQILKPKRAFDKAIFTKRELMIMDRLTEFFKEFRGVDMSEFSHKARQPWSRVFNGGEGDRNPIPIELSLAAEPIMFEMPTIDEDERRYRETLLSGLYVRART